MGSNEPIARISTNQTVANYPVIIRNDGGASKAFSKEEDSWLASKESLAVDRACRLTFRDALRHRRRSLEAMLDVNSNLSIESKDSEDNLCQQ